MKLYFSPGACSLSPHIVLRETDANFDLEQVNNQEKKTRTGKDYWTVNPKGQVPCRPTTPDAYKDISRENLGKRFDWIDKQLTGKQYLMGDKFSVADAYVFTVLRWSPRVNIDTSRSGCDPVFHPGRSDAARSRGRAAPPCRNAERATMTRHRRCRADHPSESITSSSSRLLRKPLSPWLPRILCAASAPTTDTATPACAA